MIFAILLPIYLFIGFQPASSLDLTRYPTLEIPQISLTTPVQPLSLTSDHELIAPAELAGSYSQTPSTTLLIGHSSTVFASLSQLALNTPLTYNHQTYRITSITTLAKADINMSQLLAPSDRPTLILMTCAGDPLPNQDATHRLIVTAELTAKD